MKEEERSMQKIRTLLNTKKAKKENPINSTSSGYTSKDAERKAVYRAKSVCHPRHKNLQGFFPALQQRQHLEKELLWTRKE